MSLEEFNIKPNRAGTGTNGLAVFEIISGDKDIKGRKLFHNFLIEHPNEKAVGFSNNRLNKFLAASGASETIEDLGFDYSQIMDVAGKTRVIVSVDQDEYEKDGEIKKTNKILTFKRS